MHYSLVQRCFQSVFLQPLNLPLFGPTASNRYHLHGLWISNSFSSTILNPISSPASNKKFPTWEEGDPKRNKEWGVGETTDRWRKRTWRARGCVKSIQYTQNILGWLYWSVSWDRRTPWCFRFWGWPFWIPPFRFQLNEALLTCPSIWHPPAHQHNKMKITVNNRKSLDTIF